MIQLLGPVVLIGLGDSVNPATIGVAVLLATERRPVPRLLAYTLGTALTYFVGGLILTLGPAALLNTFLHRHAGTRTHVAEIVLGVVGLGIAVWLWTRPADTVSRRIPKELDPAHALVLGAGITLVDLPTALMYFGAIAVIVAGDVSLTSRVVLLIAFNIAYVAPLLAITLAVALLRERAAEVLGRIRDWVTRWSTRLLALISAASALYLIVLGARGLA